MCHWVAGWTSSFFMKHQFLLEITLGYMVDTFLTFFSFVFTHHFYFLALSLWVGATMVSLLKYVLFPPSLCSYCQIYYTLVCHSPNNTIMYILFHMFAFRVSMHLYWLSWLITFPSILCFYFCVCVYICACLNFYLGLLNFNPYELFITCNSASNKFS